MNPFPKIQLSRLRRIGWEKWDPIRLRDLVSDDLRSGPVDEYDGYLVHVVTMLHDGKSMEEAVAYLDWASSERMGLGKHADHQASVRTVESVLAYLRTLPDGPLKPDT